MTASWQDPAMGSAYHDIHGGSQKHDAVPELFEDGWNAAITYLRSKTERNKAFREMSAILDANGDDPGDPLYQAAFYRWSKLAMDLEGS